MSEEITTKRLATSSDGKWQILRVTIPKKNTRDEIRFVAQKKSHLATNTNGMVYFRTTEYVMTSETSVLAACSYKANHQDEVADTGAYGVPDPIPSDMLAGLYTVWHDNKNIILPGDDAVDDFISGGG